jgi:hypothetical protein
MNGEDKIFLLTAVMAIISNQESMVKFLLNKNNVDRLLSIRTKLGSKAFEQELTKLKEVIES